MTRSDSGRRILLGPLSFGGCAAVVISLAAVAVVVGHYVLRKQQCIDYVGCSGYLRHIGSAIQLYVNDWDGRYPTNRLRVASHRLGPVASTVPLSKPRMNASTGKPVRFEHGVNWVESLNDYHEPVGGRGAPDDEWQCFALRQRGAAQASKTAAVSYVLNRNLVEKRSSQVRDRKHLMMVREMDRLVDAVLRPVNDSLGPGQPPESAFLTDTDVVLGHTDCNPHNERPGSNVLFADDHVQFIPVSQMPARCSWDPVNKTWDNPGRTITVTP